MFSSREIQLNSENFIFLLLNNIASHNTYLFVKQKQDSSLLITRPITQQNVSFVVNVCYVV